ncbi:MAG: hypothetical protein ABH971_01320 [bacterium]
MLAIQKQSKFIEKIIQLPNGSQVLVVFELIELNGKIIAKAICGKIIEKNIILKEEVLFLPIYFERENFKPIISPFFANVLILVKDLSFITCQPTRAPNVS